MANVQAITLSVPDVSCDHCVKTIDGTLGALTGVTSVATDIATKRVSLSYDPNQVSMEQIESALDEVGYTVAKGAQPTPRTSGKPLNLL
ncbi:MAG: heavy-metal-associated domain-containing protein [Ktedonobacteraceae bacterium]|nr:heavy-metal-associated domain-containing protein [Ktedonobacteraceae bacterium]